MTLEEGAHAIGISSRVLAAIEDGEKLPTRKQLSNLANAYRRSLLTFYLPAPPLKGKGVEDFRTLPQDRLAESEAKVDALVRDLRTRQSLIREILEDDEDTRPLDFVGSSTLTAGVLSLKDKIENLIGLSTTEYRAQPSVEKAFSLLRGKTEKAGIFVMLAGNLGSHHTNISTDVFRGLAIADAIAPFIVINDNDAKPAWSFTLLHELAHILLGATGISGGANHGVDKKIEQFCNDAAGEFLLPRSDAQKLDLRGLSTDDQIALITEHAHQWRVSRQMVAYRLHRVNGITREEWKSIATEIQARWMKERDREKQTLKNGKSSGPTYYTTRRHRLGNALIELAKRHVSNGSLPPVKAAKALGVKPRSIYALLTMV